MGLKVHINYSSEVSEIIERFQCLSFLRETDIPGGSVHELKITSNCWKYEKKFGYGIQVMFIGKSGYGKSTTLNKIVGSSVFMTSDVSACTKDLSCAVYRINKYYPAFISFCDLPGVGESLKSDGKYLKMYSKMLEHSDVVVYLLRADQRDFSEDEKIFKNLFTQADKRKVVVAINCADKIEPINRHANGLTSEQIDALNKKSEVIYRIFKIAKSNILYYSAENEINIDLLIKKITTKLKRRIGRTSSSKPKSIVSEYLELIPK